MIIYLFILYPSLPLFFLPSIHLSPPLLFLSFSFSSSWFSSPSCSLLPDSLLPDSLLPPVLFQFGAWHRHGGICIHWVWEKISQICETISWWISPDCNPTGILQVSECVCVCLFVCVCVHACVFASCMCVSMYVCVRMCVHPCTSVIILTHNSRHHSRLYNQPTAMYESAATRWFKLSRTDTIRSCTNASLAFMKTMADPNASVSMWH